MKSRYIFILSISFSIGVSGCKKILQVDQPVSTITASEVFSDSSDANSAILGIYSTIMYANNSGFGTSLITLYAGMSADELVPYNLNVSNISIYSNGLSSTPGLPTSLWTQMYKVIYLCNANIEGLKASSTILSSTRDQFIGEATFLRDFCYFYLVSCYGDVPYVTTASGWDQTKLASRTAKGQIYQALISDLQFCQKALKLDYSMSAGQRTRANQAAATALLSRVYLYTGDWKNAIAQANAVIGNTANFSLMKGLNQVFLLTSTEAILQWQQNVSNSAYLNATLEGISILPSSTTAPPNYLFSTQLLNSFELNDKRKLAWVDSSIYSGVKYYYPYKYKIGSANHSNTAPATECYMVLRLAEQYLIRAEAEAELNDLPDAINDLDTIRARAGLPNLSSSLNQAQVLAAVMQERKIELFAEWGHRWFDLKRTGSVDNVMSGVTPIKNPGGVWNSYQQLYPIPVSELQADPNLIQNVGYN